MPQERYISVCGCILNSVKTFLGLGGANVAHVKSQNIQKPGIAEFDVVANPVVIAFFEEQTKSLSERAAEMANWYENADNKRRWLSYLETVWATSGYNGDGDRDGSYYDACRAIIRIFLNNFPVIDDKFSHKILCTQKEKERLVAWECCIGRIAESLAKTLGKNALVPGIRQLAEDIGQSRESTS
jgi:hypothetical protein